MPSLSGRLVYSLLLCINTLRPAAAPFSYRTMGDATESETAVDLLEGLTVWSAVGAGALTLLYLFFLGIGEEYTCNLVSRLSGRF